MATGLLDGPLATAMLEVAAAEGLDLAAALRGGDDELRPTQVAQPALVFVELVLAAALPADLEIVGVAGHSVGEYAAVSVAGAYAPEDALRMVIRRGIEMAAMTDGAMAAVIGMDAEALGAVCAEVRSSGDIVVIANLNAPGQVVISGSAGGVERAGALARERGARRVLPLNVSGAFHSPLMAPAAARLAEVIAATPRRALRIPVACNVDGVAVQHARELPDLLGRQLDSPVRWVDCVTSLIGLGAEVLIEVGPGAVLTGLARRIDPQLRTANVASIDAARGLATLRAAPA
jgi:[acyl-carrier-protein] S-malonyltransferase